MQNCSFLLLADKSIRVSTKKGSNKHRENSFSASWNSLKFIKLSIDISFQKQLIGASGLRSHQKVINYWHRIESLIEFNSSIFTYVQRSQRTLVDSCHRVMWFTHKEKIRRFTVCFCSTSQSNRLKVKCAVWQYNRLRCDLLDPYLISTVERESCPQTNKKL